MTFSCRMLGCRTFGSACAGSVHFFRRQAIDGTSYNVTILTIESSNKVLADKDAEILMKAFITSIVILAVVITFVSINAVYVYDTSQQLLEAANALPDLEDLKLNGIKDGGDSANGGNGDNEGNGENSVNGGNGENGENGNKNAENVSETPEIIKSGENAIKNFTDIWNKNKNKLGLFIVYDYIYNIQAAVDQLTDFYAGEYYTDYSTQRNMLITAIKRMQEVEEFSLENII